MARFCAVVLQESELIRTELTKALASRSFASTDRLRGFLRYIVEETLAGRGEQIKEYAIAISVYGKPADYDPKADATVRGEANRLRTRLVEYYASEGRDARLQFHIPKGTYVPQFVKPAASNPGRRKDPANADALTQFARGRHHLLRYTPEGNARAVACFGRAVEISPEFAPAHAFLALANMQRAELMQTTYAEATREVRTQVTAALSQDPDLPEAVTALAAMQFRCHWDWNAAEASFRRAMELNQDEFYACMEFAMLLDCLGRNDEALELKRRALSLDPASPLVHVWISLHHWFRREYGEAIQWSKSALELDPHYMLAHERISWQYLKAGNRKRWAQHLLKAFKLWEGDTERLSTIGKQLEHLDQRALVDALVNRESAAFSWAAGWYSMHFAEIGETDLAFRSLDAACDQKSGALVYLKVDPSWDKIRRDARFAELLRRMRLD